MHGKTIKIVDWRMSCSLPGNNFITKLKHNSWKSQHKLFISTLSLQPSAYSGR